MKAHHCAIDGIGAMHLTQSMMSSRPRTRIRYSPFSVEACEAYRKKLGATKSRVHEPDAHELRAVAEVLKQQFDSSRNIAAALGRYANVWLGRGGDLARLGTTFRAPRSTRR